MADEAIIERAEDAADQVQQEVRPTVFIGLGGTGMEVLLRLRRRILQADWAGARINNLADFPVARFLYFDTDTNEGRETGRAATSDPMTAAVAFGKGDTLQKKVDVAFYQRDKRNHPVIAEWLPSRDLSRIDTEKGAGQIRSIARLLFFDQFDVFQRTVAEKGSAVVSNVTNESALARLGLKTQNQLRVVVVGSVAGGTGSGSFIDAGLAISSMVAPHADQVDLFLVLPGGYVGANRDRVFANSFAALSELEQVMRPSPSPPYVRFWTDNDQPSVTKPYSDVYLFDTRNLNGDQTTRVTDVFEMMADILFEDFGNSEFARRKRSIAVNQQQHKMRMFHPPLSDDYGRNAIWFSAGYSAVGQATIATTGSLEFEAGVVDAGRTMLEAFFGVAANHEGHLPSAEARDRFMADCLYLTRRSYSDFPPALRPKPPAIADYDLIDQLLHRPGEQNADAALWRDIDDGFQRIRETVDDPADWLREVRSLRSTREQDIVGAAGEQGRMRAKEVAAASDRLEKALRAGDGELSLKRRFYALLDDQDHAGLDYTIELIKQIRHRLTTDGEGVRAVLRRAAEQYASLADKMLTEEMPASEARLERAAKKGMFGGIDRTAAQNYLAQAQEDLKYGLKFRLRALAAREAITLLENVAEYMGEPLAAGPDGTPNWSGLLKEFMDGHRLVERTLDLIRSDAERVRDAIKRPDGGSFQVIGGGAARTNLNIDPKAALAWAKEAFRDFGGCRKLFEMLRSESDRLRVLNQLRSIAKQELSDVEARIPTAIDALRAMTPDEQRKTLSRMLSRAMPWIHGQFDRFKPNGDQFKMIIAVANSNEFQEEFGKYLPDLMPKGLGMAPPGIEESGVPGRIVCYCELSGIPLDVIAPLRDDWRKSYDRELSGRDPLPLHNHEDYLRYPNPVAPSVAELEALRGELRLFLKGVVYGVLRRRRRDGEPDRQLYEIDMSVSDWQSVGAERTIRRKRFDLVHRRRLEEAVTRFESNMTPLQMLAAGVLFEWTARRAYAPRLERTSTDRETRLPGLTNKVATELAAEMQKSFAAAIRSAQPKVDADAARRTLLDKIDQWTQVIAGSLADVEAGEANQDLEDNPDYRAQDKRTIDPAWFTDAALQAVLAPGPSAHASAPPPPPETEPVCFYLAESGQTKGPFGYPELRTLAEEGRLNPATQVYDALSDGPWQPARFVDRLVPLLARPAPPPPASVE